jgi:integral membrane protein
VRKTILGRLHRIGYSEGISFLLLLGVAMPLKYLAGMPQMVLVVGSLHGFLFILYVATLLQARSALKWPRRKLHHGLIASVLPFGPFVFDARLRKEAAAEKEEE